jgi:hypothetical protein
MDTGHQVAARVDVRYVGNQEDATDREQESYQEQYDNCVEGALGDARPVPRQGNNERYSKEGKAGKAAHDSQVHLRRVVEEEPGVATVRS